MQVVWRKFSGCHSKDTDPGSGDLKRYVHLQIEVDVDRWAKLPDRYFTRGGNGPACTYRVKRLYVGKFCIVLVSDGQHDLKH